MANPTSASNKGNPSWHQSQASFSDRVHPPSIHARCLVPAWQPAESSGSLSGVVQVSLITTAGRRPPPPTASSDVLHAWEHRLLTVYYTRRANQIQYWNWKWSILPSCRPGAYCRRWSKGRHEHNLFSHRHSEAHLRPNMARSVNNPIGHYPPRPSPTLTVRCHTPSYIRLHRPFLHSFSSACRASKTLLDRSPPPLYYSLDPRRNKLGIAVLGALCRAFDILRLARHGCHHATLGA